MYERSSRCMPYARYIPSAISLLIIRLSACTRPLQHARSERTFTHQRNASGDLRVILTVNVACFQVPSASDATLPSA